MIRVLCLGSAACMAEDLAAAAELGIAPGVNGWVLCAVNHAGRQFDGPLPHWASMHANLFPMWTEQRRRAGRPDAGTLWGAKRRVVPHGFPLSIAPNWGGSSGLLAVSVALNGLGADRVILCGIPIDAHQGHFDDGKRVSPDMGNYKLAWQSAERFMRGKVKSMSGHTQRLLGGAPTREWLDGTDGRSEDGDTGCPARHDTRSEGRDRFGGDVGYDPGSEPTAKAATPLAP
jgi:hypothetical protein